MTQKFGRSYRLTIDPHDGDQPILITLPFTIEFSLQRRLLSDLNQLVIDVFNLSENNRARIFQDRFDGDRKKTLIFEAGYSTLYRIFEGPIYEAGSSRDGTNIITHIEARSGIYDVPATQTYQTMQSGQTLGDVLKFLIGQFPNLKLGAIGEYKDVMQRPVVLNGNTWNLLKIYSAGKVFIDNGKVYVLKDNEVLKGQIPLINDSTGLLDTPHRDQGLLVVNTLLETSVNMAGKLKLESSVQKVYNGEYKVIGVTHQGTISAARAGQCRSIFSLLAPNQFREFKEVQGNNNG